MDQRAQEATGRDVESRTTAELAVACRAGDLDAWDALLARYQRLVFAIATREGLSSDDAADVTQTTFEALLAQLERIRDDSQIGSWLMTVARRQAWRIRTDRRRQVVDGASIEADPDLTDPIADLAVMLCLHEAIAQLEQPCRELITALYFEPKTPSYAELASMFDRPLGSIGPTRARCLERLRAILGDTL